MIPAVSPEIAVAMLRQERLTWLGKRVEADQKVATIEAQIAGAELVLKLQEEAAKAEAEAADAPADPAPPEEGAV